MDWKTGEWGAGVRDSWSPGRSPRLGVEDGHMGGWFTSGCCGRLTLQRLLAVQVILAWVSVGDAVFAASDRTTESGFDTFSMLAVADSELAQLLATLERDTPLRLHLAGDGIVQGVLVRTHTESLVVSPDIFEERTVQFDAVETLWLQHGHNAARGWKWGAIAGGFLAPFVLAWLAFTYGHGVSPGAILLGLPSGIVVGGAVGAGIGRLIPEWEQRYP